MLRFDRVFVLLGALVLLPSPARATPNFPDAVAAHLALSTKPDCTLCHAGAPGRGTVTTPFGTTLRSRGAAAYDEAALRLALDALAAENKDSDADGISDIEELRAGDDPNGGAAVVLEYGCSMRRPGDGTGFAAISCMCLVALRRRRVSVRRRLWP
jgi:hypothetical protein